jgi:hypothetical protein
MSTLFSPWTLAIAGILTIIATVASPNAALWAACVLTLPIAVWLLGGKQASRVLLWLIAIAWLQIIGDVIVADLNGVIIFDEWLGPYRVEAIIFSLCAITVLAIGMRVGMRVGGWPFRPVVQTSAASPIETEQSVSLNRIVLCYLASLVLTQVLNAVAFSVPALTQPVLALTLIKFVCIYLIAARVFESKCGYNWLIFVSLLEMVTGLVGYFSSYKEAFFVMLIAMASSRRRPSVREWIFGITAVLAVVLVSLVWTAGKKEYRLHIVGGPIEQRIEWMAGRIFVDKTDYGDAFKKMFERIGYTELFARMLERQDVGSLPSGFNFYSSAVQNVLMPRILFPDKAALNDSKITTALLGISIDKDTSIGIGYVAQAYYDFGAPGFLIPVFLIGLMTGAAAKYFMTRSAPLMIQEAFATAALFLSFQFAANVDKAFGGFVISCLVMGLALKFGYPMIAQWLAGPRAKRLDFSEVSVGRSPSRKC